MRVRCESECDAMFKDGSRRSVLCLKKIFPCNSTVFYFRVSEIIVHRPICTVGSCIGMEDNLEEIRLRSEDTCGLSFSIQLKAEQQASIFKRNSTLYLQGLL